MRIALTVMLAVALTAGAAFAQDAEPAAEEAAEAPPAIAGERVQDDLVVLYRFDNVLGDRVIPDLTRDVGGLDLVIQGAIVGVPLQTISLRDDGVRFGAVEEIQVPGVFSTEPASEIVEAVGASGQLTVEAWVTPAADNLTGPARIVTISRSTGERNITLGQERDTYQLRLRTSANEEGAPYIHTPQGSLVVNELQHVVVTFDGESRIIYLDGEPLAQSTGNAGTLYNWDETMYLVIGNETDGDRRWYGSVHLVAFYAAALSPQQIQQNFEAGL